MRWLILDPAHLASHGNQQRKRDSHAAVGALAVDGLSEAESGGGRVTTDEFAALGERGSVACQALLPDALTAATNITARR